MLKLIRPGTLEQGRLYLRRKPSAHDDNVTATLVRFSSYTACPALVIIQDSMGKKVRCTRDDLFEVKDIPFPFRMSMFLKTKIQTLELYDVLLPVRKFIVVCINPKKFLYYFLPEIQEIIP